jgi:CubicO group peptidase (beta-lactamase class C family)
VQGEVHDENAAVLGGVCGHAGLFSTAKDMAVLCKALLSGTLLHPATLYQMTRNWTAGLNLARGLGWQKKDPDASPAGDIFTDASYGHTGFTGTSLWLDPELNCFAVLLTNRIHPSREGEGIHHVRRIFHNVAALEVNARCR